METQAPLTNAERRDDVLFLLERFEAGEHRPPELLDDDEKRRFLGGDTHTQRRLFYRLLCYGALAAQPAPEALVRADWQRLRTAGLPDDIFDRRFDIERFAAAAPVARTDSKGRIIDFVRLSETRDIWARLLPWPADPATVVDVLYACSGGALKSRAFWVVREMIRGGLWQPTGLDRYACVPDGRVRKRAARIGLVDLDEKADSIDDMKAVSAALHAALGLGGNGSRSHYDLPVSAAEQRCEMCDRERMAGCAMPHCRHRRAALGGA
ncbi:MAG: hypothetical protein ABR941_00110 [Thermoleophilia bacterium]